MKPEEPNTQSSSLTEPHENSNDTTRISNHRNENGQLMVPSASLDNIPSSANPSAEQMSAATSAENSSHSKDCKDRNDSSNNKIKCSKTSVHIMQEFETVRLSKKSGLRTERLDQRWNKYPEAMHSQENEPPGSSSTSHNLSQEYLIITPENVDSIFTSGNLGSSNSADIDLSLNLSPIDLENSTLLGIEHFITSNRYLLEKNSEGKVLRVIDKNSGNVVDCQPRLKLEVIRADSIRHLFNASYIAYAIAFLLVIIFTILVNTKYATRSYYFSYRCDNGTIVEYCGPSSDPPTEPGCTELIGSDNMKGFSLPRPFTWLTRVTDYIWFVYSTMLAANYLFHFFQVDKTLRVHEQYVTIFLVIAVCLFLIPYSTTRDILAETTGTNLSPNAITYPSLVFESIFAFISFFYIWVGAHYYRYLMGRPNWKFYIPKIAAILGYVILSVLTYELLEFDYGYPPPASFIITIVFLSRFKFRWEILLVGIIITIYELVLVGFIVMAFHDTRILLYQRSFLEFRSKQVGFRVFSYHNMLHYAVFIPSVIILISAFPQASDFCKYYSTGIFLNGISIGWIPLLLMIVCYTTCQSYFNLPSSSLGVIAWFQKKTHERRRRKNMGKEDVDTVSEGEQDSDQPIGELNAQMITYAKTESVPVRYDARRPSGSCFVIQTHVRLFNYAWLSYSYHKKRLPFDLKNYVYLDHVTEIFDQETDTRVLVISLLDRIVVSFKGTTSLKNIGTDVKFNYASLEDIIPLSEERFETLGPLWPHWRYKLARVHNGFARAYASVSVRVKEVIHSLYTQDQRPLFFTGHSLGGALATICSLDATINYIFLRNLHREIFVSTFGSPRVGNLTFASIYDSLVIMHWRVVIQSDLVPALPKLGYSHVGKKILLTVSGLLFLDPSTLESKIWHGNRKNLTWHKKSYYLWAIKLWCREQHGDSYVPDFWPWKLEFDPENIETLLPESLSFEAMSELEMEGET